MPNQPMDIQELAAYLQRDARDLQKLASRGQLPGRKVGGEWRFTRAEINHWISTRLPEWDEAELTALESTGSAPARAGELVVSPLLSEACIAVPLNARTKTSVLRELVQLAEQSWHVYDAEAIRTAIEQREEMGSTAMPGGVAIPHIHRPMPNALGDSVIAYGRTLSGIPFGADLGQLTDIFFLVLSQDDRTHLRVLARLARLLLQPGFADQLRAAETPADTWQLIDTAERELPTS
jgi:PTS system nitrogen regulatory IIA component